MARILLVEDDVVVRESVSAYLGQAGHQVRAVADGAAALSAGPADVVVLDLMLPGVGGLEVCRHLRRRQPDIGIIMLTAKSQEHERVSGLAAGADDYLTKPFSLRELALRVAALCRRMAGPPAAPEPIRSGELIVDPVARSARLGTKALTLTAREFDLLHFLVRHPDQVHSRDELLHQVWGWEVGDASTVTVHVRRLREKLEADPARPTALVTVFGRGYRWDGPCQSS